jgi:hypothetical protein
MRFAPSYKVIPDQNRAGLADWNVQNDPVTELTSAPSTGGDPAQGFAKAVEMMQQQWPLPQFDAGTMCPSYRVTRDEQHSTRAAATSAPGDVRPN